MKLLVSIHDVSPAWQATVNSLWELCRHFQVTPALFVVPNWHGGWPLQRYPDFMRWVRDCGIAGSELFLHGHRHDEFQARRSLRDDLHAIGRTAREGEFLSLTYDEAAGRIAEGLSVLDQCGVRAIGFVPPAWLARECTFAAARDAGLAFSEDAGRVHLLARDTVLRAPAIRWSGRSTMRAHASALIAASRWHVQRDAPVLRLALHPQDLNHPVTARSLRSEVERFLNHGHVTRYADL